MKLTTYRSLLTGGRTMLVASIGKCGYAEYREIQIHFDEGRFIVEIVDGYKLLKTFVHRNNLKSALNIAEGYAKTI